MRTDMSRNDRSSRVELKVDGRPLTLEFVLCEVKRILDEERRPDETPEKRAA